MYQTLYQKWRPESFSDLEGQDVIRQTLTNAIERGRVAHAYLLCGPRGTGKTSTARVFAKGLNCMHGPTASPCGHCDACEAISNGRSDAVVEVDAASNRRVDDIRNLNEDVKYAAVQGRYKIYIIDEVHMLTKEAFNALLKTLEEPPANVIFILATTEPEKLLPTIRSRCQRFDFGLLTDQDIANRLSYIATQEGITIDSQSIDLIARASEGSMRDAISILDQVISYAGGIINIHDVSTMLRRVDNEALMAVIEFMNEGNTEGMLKMVQAIIDNGNDSLHFLKDLQLFIRNIILTKESVFAEMLEDSKEWFSIAAERFTISRLMRIMEILSEAQEKLKGSDQRIPLELAMVKIGSKEADLSMANIIERLSCLEMQVRDLSLQGVNVDWNSLLTKLLQIFDGKELFK